MAYIPADIARKAAKGAGVLRSALDDEDSNSSREIRDALKDPRLRLWLETWVMPGLDDLRTVVEHGADALDH